MSNAILSITFQFSLISLVPFVKQFHRVLPNYAVMQANTAPQPPQFQHYYAIVIASALKQNALKSYYFSRKTSWDYIYLCICVCLLVCIPVR